MKLRIELFVENLDRSMKFYSDVLGFSLPTDTNSSYIPVRKGNVVLGLGEMEKLPKRHPLKGSDGQQIGLGVEIVLVVEDVKAIYNKVIAKAYPIQAELTKRPWGLEDFRIVDPDGYYLRITS